MCLTGGGGDPASAPALRAAICGACRPAGCRWCRSQGRQGPARGPVRRMTAGPMAGAAEPGQARGGARIAWPGSRTGRCARLSCGAVTAALTISSAVRGTRPGAGTSAVPATWQAGQSDCPPLPLPPGSSQRSARSPPARTKASRAMLSAVGIRWAAPETIRAATSIDRRASPIVPVRSRCIMPAGCQQIAEKATGFGPRPAGSAAGATAPHHACCRDAETPSMPAPP